MYNLYILYLYQNITLWKEYVLTAELNFSDGLIKNSVPISAATITTIVLTVIRTTMYGMCIPN